MRIWVGPMRYLSTSVRPNSAKKTLAVRMGLMKFNLVCSLMLYDSVSYPQTAATVSHRQTQQTHIDSKAKRGGCKREEAQAHVP